MSSSVTYSQKTVSVSSIKIRNRLREDNGDIDSLAKSISRLGLMQIPVVSKNNFLIAGYHRYLAVKQLGWDEIPVRIAEIPEETSHDP